VAGRALLSLSGKDRQQRDRRSRGGLGIAKDLYKGVGLEVDLGAYVTQDYSDLFPACAAFGAAGRRGRFDPAFGVGLNVSF